jgi:hypothetical protein
VSALCRCGTEHSRSFLRRQAGQWRAQGTDSHDVPPVSIVFCLFRCCRCWLRALLSERMQFTLRSFLELLLVHELVEMSQTRIIHVRLKRKGFVSQLYNQQLWLCMTRWRVREIATTKTDTQLQLLTTVAFGLPATYLNTSGTCFAAQIYGWHTPRGKLATAAGFLDFSVSCIGLSAMRTNGVSVPQSRSASD